MERVVKLRLMFWFFFLAIMGFSVIFSSCRKDELESDFSVLAEGIVKINNTYLLNGVTEFDVVLIKEDTNVVSIRYGENVSTSAGVISGSVRHIVVDGDFVRFSSSDYNTRDNVERYDAEVKVSNLR